MANVFERHLKPLPNSSFFLFGPRGCGKSTFLDQRFHRSTSLFFDLLDPELVETFTLHPNRFLAEIQREENRDKTVIIDEIQKVPKLLDIIHQQMVRNGRTFVLTGSSARRLKQSGVNLLAGRALVYHLHPFSSAEIKDVFDLSRVLARGLLPASYLAPSDEASREYLKAYVFTYLEKEIQQEQWVRKLDPFRRFLEVAGQSSGMVINRSKIARDIGVDDMTVQSYFEILEDTLMGFFLPAFHRSVRKQQRAAPKFYLCDLGILRALSKTLSLPCTPGTYAFGTAFEHLIVQELRKTIEERRLDWSLSYLLTKDGVEIDVIIDRPGMPLVALEIKSTNRVTREDGKNLRTLGPDLGPGTERTVWSLDPLPQEWDGVRACHWQEGLARLGLA